MTCEVQSPGTAKPLAVGLGQVIAETPNWKVVTVGGVTKMRVVACRVPVEARSTSASPPPNTLRGPGTWRSESTSPRKAGVEPNGPDQRCVTNSCQDSPTIAMVPSARTLISGSLVPSGRSNCVFVKVRLPLAVAPLAICTAHKIATAGTLNNQMLRIGLMRLSSWGEIPSQSRVGEFQGLTLSYRSAELPKSTAGRLCAVFLRDLKLEPAEFAAALSANAPNAE